MIMGIVGVVGALVIWAWMVHILPKDWRDERGVEAIGDCVIFEPRGWWRCMRVREAFWVRGIPYTVCTRPRSLAVPVAYLERAAPVFDRLG